MSGCKAEHGQREICNSTDSPIICRFDGKTQRCVGLKPGIFYPAWTPLTFSSSVPTQVEMLTSHTQPIAGILTCAIDLTNEKEPCEQKILCGANFDINMINWPEAFTVPQLEEIMAKSDKPCFSSRIGCIELPAWVIAPNETEEKS